MKTVKIDMHVHTIMSFDSVNTPKFILHMCRRKKLDGVLLLDHNKYPPESFIKYLRRRGLIVLFGNEFKTVLGEIIVVGTKFNVHWFRESPLELIEKTRDENGLTILPHPFSRGRNFKDINLVIRQVDVVEGFNARCFSQRENLRAMEYARRYNRAMTAGSDAHVPFEIGIAYTLVAAESEIEDLMEAIRKGKTALRFKIKVPIWRMSSAPIKAFKPLISYMLRGVLF